MAGKFLKREAIIATVKSEHRANAVRNRRGLNQHPISAHPCGCPDPNCGAFHLIRTDQAIPTTEEADAALGADQVNRKASKKARKKEKATPKKRRQAGPNPGGKAE